MSTFRLGCDLCQIGMIEHMLKEEPTSLERLFTFAERNYAVTRAEPAQHLAGMFAAKEALAKAIRNPGLLGKYHGEVIVRHLDDGAPYLQVSEMLAATFARQGIRVVDLSISHDGEYALAAVLVELTDGVETGTRDDPTLHAGLATPKAKAAPLRCAQCLLTLDYLRDQGVTDAFIRLDDTAGAPRYLCPPCFRGW